MNDDYYLKKAVKKASKDYGEKPEVRMKSLEKEFVRSVNTVPASMLEELFDIFLNRFEPTEEAFFQFSEKLSDLLDLFSGNYDDRRDPLKLEEWEVIGSVANDYAVEIDEDILTYIMVRVVERKAL